MAQRRHIRASEVQDGRSERPATGYGEPEAGAPYSDDSPGKMGLAG